MLTREQKFFVSLFQENTSLLCWCVIPGRVDIGLSGAAQISASWACARLVRRILVDGAARVCLGFQYIGHEEREGHEEDEGIFFNQLSAPTRSAGGGSWGDADQEMLPSACKRGDLQRG